MMFHPKRKRIVSLKTAGLLAITWWLGSPNTSTAHHPDRACQPIRPRVEVIPPIGHRIPDHRRRYNRPSDWIGHLAHKFAPTSQEAMSWHAAEHRGDYDRDCPVRVVPRYEFAKPWEVLLVGARPDPRRSPQEDRPATRPDPSGDFNRLDQADNPLSDSEETQESPTSDEAVTDEMDLNDINLDKTDLNEMNLEEKKSGMDSKQPKLEPPKPRVEPTSEEDFAF